MDHREIILANISPDAISAIASDHSGVIILVVVCALFTAAILTILRIDDTQLRGPQS